MRNQAEPQDLWIADRRLWLTADKLRAVEDGDPESAFLLIAPGRSMSRARADELGVIPHPSEPTPEPDLKEKTQPEDKEREKPEDKQKKKPATKKRRK